MLIGVSASKCSNDHFSFSTNEHLLGRLFVSGVATCVLIVLVCYRPAVARRTARSRCRTRTRTGAAVCSTRSVHRHQLAWQFLLSITLRSDLRLFFLSVNSIDDLPCFLSMLLVTSTEMKTTNCFPADAEWGRPVPARGAAAWWRLLGWRLHDPGGWGGQPAARLPAVPRHTLQAASGRHGQVLPQALPGQGDMSLLFASTIPFWLCLQFIKSSIVSPWLHWELAWHCKYRYIYIFNGVLLIYCSKGVLFTNLPGWQSDSRRICKCWNVVISLNTAKTTKP